MARERTPNQGGSLLKALGKTQLQVSIEVGTSAPAVTQWVSGQTKPVKAMRQVLWTRYRIPVESWDEPVVALEATATQRPEGPFELSDQLQSLESSYYDLVGSLSTLQPMERAKVLNASASILAQIARIRGDDHKVGQRFIKSPEWTQIKEAIQRGCGGYPEAAASIARELRKVDE